MNRPRAKRILFWLLLAAAGAASIWWTLRMPHRSGAVLAAIPEEALWVSLHPAPASRIGEWTRNGAIRAGATLAGVDMEALVRELETPSGRTWVRRLGSREAAVAYLPTSAYSDEPAWILSCWAGGYSQRLRWLLAVSGIKPVEGAWGDGAHPVWRLKAAGLPRGLRLALGIREGVVVLAFSTDPVPAIIACLDAAEGTPRARSVLKAKRLEAVWAERLDPACRDRGWLNRPGPRDAWIGARTLTARGTEAAVLWPGPAHESLGQAVTGNVAALSGLMAKAEGVATVPWPMVRDFALTQPGDWIGPLDALVREAAGTDQVRVVVGVYGGDYAARIRSLFGGGIESFIQGLKVPTFVAAVPVADEPQAREAMNLFLDRVNRVKPYGLVPRPAGVCFGREVTAIEATRGELYRNFAPSEQVAFVVAEGWLVVGSHLGALQELLPSIAHGQPAGPGEPGLRVRVDAPAFSQTMGKFLAALSLAYVVADTPEAERTRARLGEGREWLKALAPLGQVDVRGASNPEGWVLSVVSSAD